MALVAGTRLGPYEIHSLIGAGGMGEVYRARDARLDRDVAIKVLPPAVSADADRHARFEREARWFAIAGDRERALDWLERWVDRGSFNYPMLAHGDPFFESVRGEPRFLRVLDRVRPIWERFVPRFVPPDVA